MPNWFYFTITVSGEKEEVRKFVSNVEGSEKYDTKGREFDFNHFIPQPDNIYRDNISFETQERLEKEGVPNWYDWNRHNWGTKWNAVCDDRFSVSIDGFPFEQEYNLRTAWAFPNEVIEKMIEMYPNLDFTIVGEEESGAYGVYIDSSQGIWDEEEPVLIDEENNKVVFWDKDTDLWRYVDDNTEVPDNDMFWPTNSYSWS